jgi:hypothetical protein
MLAKKVKNYLLSALILFPDSQSFKWQCFENIVVGSFVVVCIKTLHHQLKEIHTIGKLFPGKNTTNFVDCILEYSYPNLLQTDITLQELSFGIEKAKWIKKV